MLWSAKTQGVRRAVTLVKRWRLMMCEVITCAIKINGYCGYARELLEMRR